MRVRGRRLRSSTTAPLGGRRSTTWTTSSTGSRSQFIAADLREPRRGTHRPAGRGAAGARRPLLRAHRRPRRQHRRAGAVRRHRRAAQPAARSPRIASTPAAIPPRSDADGGGRSARGCRGRGHRGTGHPVRWSAVAWARSPVASTRGSLTSLTSGSTASLQAIERVAARLEDDAEAQAARMHQLQVAVDALPLGFVVVDHDERVLLRNAPAEHFLGVRYADALVEEAVRTNLRAALAGEPSTQTLDLHGPPRRIVVVRALPVEETGAGVAIALIEDVSERSRLEAMRTDFVSNISHELRTPVGALGPAGRDPGGRGRAGAHEPPGAEDGRRVGTGGAHRRGPARAVEVWSRTAVPARRWCPSARWRPRPPTGCATSPPSATSTSWSPRPRAGYRSLGDRRQLVSAIANLIENGVKYSDPGRSSR